ncbi:MAG TPA: hypothetical protein VF063_09780 [Gaiellaceae bacterium]
MHISKNANLNCIFSFERIRGFASFGFGYFSFIEEVTLVPDRISVCDRRSRIGRLRFVGGAALLAATFVAYGTFASTARADSADTVSPAAAATYPAGDAGTAAPAATDAVVAAVPTATEATSASAGAEPAQYHEPQNPQYHATTAVSTTSAFTGTNVRTVAARLAADPAPAIRHLRAHVPIPDAAQARVAMRLSVAAQGVAVKNASPSSPSRAAAQPASMHILTHAIAVRQSRDISVSDNSRPVVSPSRNRLGTASSVETKKRQISHPISSRIQETRIGQKVGSVSVARHSAKSASISARTAPVLRPARRGSAAPMPARAVHPARVTALSDPPVKNPRAMLQLGMLFGLAYLGFLAIWFWSTRFRRSVRRPLRL